jgi:hypothetical protein
LFLFLLLWFYYEKSNFNVAEINALDKAETLFTDGQLSEVFGSQVLVDVSFLGVEIIFKFELGGEGLSVIVSCGDELSQLLDFILDGGEVNSDLSNLSLEGSELSVQVLNSLLISSDVFGLGGSQVVDGINNCASEFVQFIDDFSQKALVGEVLAGGQVNQSLDQSGVLGVRSDSGLDLSQ